MNETSEPRSTARPSRRTIARGAAWSVPVVAVTAAAPAFAASGGTATVQGSCSGTSRTASITVDVTGTSAGSVIVTFTGTGTFAVSAPAGTTSCGTNCYVVPVVNGTASATFGVTFTIGQSGQETVTATVSSSGGQVISGDTTGSVTKRRDGNSGNYPCVSTT